MTLISLIFVRATVVIALAYVVTWLLRRRAAVRSIVWSAAAICLLVLPLLSVVVTSRSITVPILPAAIDATVDRAAMSVQPLRQDLQVISTGGATAGTTPRRDFPRAAFLVVWALGVGGFLGRLALAVRASRRLVSGLNQRSPDTRVQQVLTRVCEAVRLSRQPHVALSDAVAVPITTGLLRPCVLLPHDADGWTSDHLDAVLRHEVAHIARRDYATRLAFEVACALYWPNPLVWRAAARARVAQECAADDFVLEGGATPEAYASMLVAIARSSIGAPASHASSLAMSTPPLKLRVSSILDGRTRHGTLNRRFATLIATIAIGLLSPALAIFSFAAAPHGSAMRTVASTDHHAGEASDEPFFSASADSLIRTLYYDDSPRRRLAAARAIGRQDKPRATLIDLLADTCRGNRWRAARALRELADARALNSLIATMLSDADEAVRSMAANAIAALPLSKSAPALRSALAGQPLSTFGRAGLALDTLGDTPVHGALLSVLREVRRGRPLSIPQG